VGAIELERAAGPERFAAEEVIFATGFRESAPEIAPEFGLGSHPDIISAMAFEALSREDGPHGGSVTRPSNGRAVRSLAFIQCAGSRDVRYQAYCAGVCCMHALKQARWALRRDPGLSCALFYTDLRSVGKSYESYARAAEKQGLMLIRSRPGLVLAPGESRTTEGVVLRYEEMPSGKTILAEFDLVVLNSGLAMCPVQSEKPGALTGSPGKAGQKHERCGFCQEPSDVSQAAVQGARAAALSAARLLGSEGRTL
jgi:heterodisulfide reductase subunit A-like polyferredoxin